MAKYLAQIVVLGAQVVGRAFARAVREEFATSRAAAQQGGSRNRQQAAANIKLGMTVQEAKDILNISEVDLEKIQKNYEHLFTINDKSKGGSFYLQSKALPWQYQAPSCLLQQCTLAQRHVCSYSTFARVFSNESKQQCVSRLKAVKSFYKSRRKDVKEAAVLIPLCYVSGLPSIVFTLRSLNMERHRGGVSFPGGMKDVNDADLVQTALRETEEEIGVPSRDVDVWTPFSPVASRSGRINITPVLAFIGDFNPENCQFNRDEVATVFTRTLESLCDPANFRTTQFRTRHGHTVPVFLGGEHRIWGVTSALLHQTLQALVPEKYNFEITICKLKT